MVAGLTVVGEGPGVIGAGGATGTVLEGAPGAGGAIAAGVPGLVAVGLVPDKGAVFPGAGADPPLAGAVAWPSSIRPQPTSATRRTAACFQIAMTHPPH